MLRNEIESLIEELDDDVSIHDSLFRDSLDAEEAEYFRGYSEALDITRQKLDEILFYQKIYGG